MATGIARLGFLLPARDELNVSALQYPFGACNSRSLETRSPGSHRSLATAGSREVNYSTSGFLPQATNDARSVGYKPTSTLLQRTTAAFPVVNKSKLKDAHLTEQISEEIEKILDSIEVDEVNELRQSLHHRGEQRGRRRATLQYPEVRQHHLPRAKITCNRASEILNLPMI